MNPILCCVLLAGTAIAIAPKAIAQTDDDKKFVMAATQGGENEIALSEVAVQKATNRAVKAFAEKMVKEHKEMAAGMKPFVEQWSINAPTGVDADHQKELNKLNGLSGKDFDKEYIDAMVSDHAKALDAFTDEAKNTKETKFQAVVLKDKTRVAAHKNMAYDLKQKL